MTSLRNRRELLAGEQPDLSGDAMAVYERYLFIQDPAAARDIFRWGLQRHAVLFIEPLPDTAPAHVRELLSYRPFVLYEIHDRNAVCRKQCAEWFQRERAAKKLAQDVYFLQAGTNGPIKIGIAQNTANRINALQTGCPWPITILARIEAGGPQLERKLHKRFAHLSTSGEWFSPGPDLVALISAVNALNILSRFDTLHLAGKWNETLEKIRKDIAAA